MNHSALLIIDVQNDYFQGGKMELFQPEQALQKINALENHFIQTEQPIIYVQHIFEGENAPFFQAGTHGVELSTGLQLKNDSIIIKKQTPNSFFQTELKDILEKLAVEKLIITGMMTHMCVDATTRAATELGYQPVIISDATATCDLSFADRTVQAIDVQTAYLSAFQMIAQIQSAEEFLK